MQLTEMRSCHTKAEQVRTYVDFHDDHSVGQQRASEWALLIVLCPLLSLQVYSFTDENVAAAQTLLQAHINVNALDTVY
jgi:hypothetical protein